MENEPNKGGVVMAILGGIVGVYTLGMIGYGFFSYEDKTYPEPTYGQHCCVYCSLGQACGDSCIEQSDVCHVGRGCACDSR